jgi:catechol 2,3-dioxygenase-like lactoylglutathione lyase family enzyme
MIQHVTRAIPPATLDACIAFYETLGLRRVPVPEGIAGRAVWLEWPEVGARSQLLLMPADDAVPDPGHFAVVCRDYEATVRALEQGGHEVNPRRRHWGAPRAYVRDPSGNLVELMAWMPGAAAES